MTFAREQELRRERAELEAKIKENLDREQRTAEDDNTVDAMFADIDKKDADIQRLVRGAKLLTSKEQTPQQQPIDPIQKVGESRTIPGGKELSTEERQNYIAAVRSFLLDGKSGIGADEKRALMVAGSDISGGYFIMNQQMAGGILKKMDDEVFIRNRGTKFTVPQAQSLGQFTLETDPGDFDWTTELKTGNEDTATEFGIRELYPHPMARRLKISEKLIRSSSVDLEAFVIDRLGYKAALTEEKAFLLGDGNQKPLGIMVPDDRGIGTARDITCGGTTNFTADGLMDVVYSVKTQYLAKCVWGLSREAIKRIRKLKDGDGQYLWTAGLQAGQPDLILGRPFFASEHMPSTFTTGQYVGFFGCLEYYYIADALNMRLQRLEELYAETNQIGFILRKETDAMPVLAEAFSRLKLA